MKQFLYELIDIFLFFIIFGLCFYNKNMIQMILLILVDQMGLYLGIDLDDIFDYFFKIVLIGDVGVGKICVVQRFKLGIYVEKYGLIIGVDFIMKMLQIDGKLIKVFISSLIECVLNKSIFF